MSTNLKTFISLGVRINNEFDTEVSADCPFCGVDDKLYINKDEGVYHCKVCSSSGNKYTFLSQYYDIWFERTTLTHYRTLSTQRNNLPYKAFKMAELAYNSDEDLWLIPVRNDKGSVVNIRRWSPKTNIMMHTSGCIAGLYNLERISHKTRKIYICEGEWDAISMEYFLLQNKIKDCAVVAVPGASVFKDAWGTLFLDKEVVFLYDCDDPGQKGMQRAIKLLRKCSKPRTIHKLVWPEETPDKFDIRDYVCKNVTRLDRAWNEFSKMLVQEEVHNREERGIVRHTFDSVVEDFSKHIYLPEDARKALLLQFAVIFSNKIPGDPLWLFIVGPPGGGKTLMLQSVSDTDDTHYESSLTPKLLVSGFKTNDGTDPSLLPQIIGKTLVIKEYTEVMGLSAADQDQIFAVLRGAYDGRVERSYAHGVHRVYPEPGGKHKTCHFSILAGVTNVIHGNNRAALGERFLKYQMFPDQHDPIKQIKSAINAALSQELPEFELREPASAFIEHKIKQGVKLPPVPTWVQERVIGLSQIVSVVRATVSRKQGELMYRPAPEIGTRLSKQLIKLGQCIAFTLDRPEVDEECYALVQRVAMDTCYGWHRDVILAIYGKDGGVYQKDVYQEARIGMSTGSRCLNDLYELGAIDYTEEETGRRGKQPKLWTLSAQMQNLFDIAKIDKSNIISDIPEAARLRTKTARTVKC